MFFELAFFQAKKDEAEEEVGDVQLQVTTSTLNLNFVKWEVEV